MCHGLVAEPDLNQRAIRNADRQGVDETGRRRASRRRMSGLVMRGFIRHNTTLGNDSALGSNQRSAKRFYRYKLYIQIP